MNLFAILGPAFPAKFADATSDDDGLPWLDPDENVVPEDKPDPTTWTLGTPDPLAQLGDDAE